LESSAACFCLKPKLFATYAIIIDFSLSAVKEINFFEINGLLSFTFHLRSRIQKGFPGVGRKKLNPAGGGINRRDAPFLPE
jgi:hypothetical protein